MTFDPARDTQTAMEQVSSPAQPDALAIDEPAPADRRALPTGDVVRGAAFSLLALVLLVLGDLVPALVAALAAVLFVVEAVVHRRRDEQLGRAFGRAVGRALASRRR